MSVIGRILGTVGNSIAGSVVHDAAKEIFKSEARWMWNGVGELVSGFFTNSTRPAVDTAAFVGEHGAYHDAASVAILILVGCVLVAIIQATLSGEPLAGMARVARDTPLSIVAIIGLPWLVDELLSVSDVVSDVVLPSQKTAVALMADVNNMQIDPVSAACGGLGLVAALAVYFELVVRSDLVYIATALAPLSFAAMTVPSMRASSAQAFRLILAAVMSKPAVYLALRIGADMSETTVGHLQTPSNLGKTVATTSILGIAALMPWIVWRLLPMADPHTLAQGVSRAPARAGIQAMQSAYWFQALSAGRGAGGGAGGGGGGGGAPGAGVAMPPVPIGPPRGGPSSGSGSGSSSGTGGPAGPAGAGSGGLPTPPPVPPMPQPSGGGPSPGTGTGGPGSTGSAPGPVPTPTGPGRRPSAAPSPGTRPTPTRTPPPGWTRRPTTPGGSQ